jgi:hypothetical protein
MEGVKHDSEKLRLDLIPVDTLHVMAEVFGYGAAKYEPYNYRKGIDYSRIYAAALRHLTAFWSGEDNDSESGLPHLGHALCCLSMLREMTRCRPERDDRPK